MNFEKNELSRNVYNYYDRVQKLLSNAIRKQGSALPPETTMRLGGESLRLVK